MFQRQGVFLKGGPEVGQGKVSGVACLGEEAEVGKFQNPNQFRRFPEERPVGDSLSPGMDQQQGSEEQEGAGECEKPGGVPGRHCSIPLRIPRFTWGNVRTPLPLWSALNSRASASFRKGINSRPMGPKTSLPVTYHPLRPSSGARV